MKRLFPLFYDERNAKFLLGFNWNDPKSWKPPIIPDAAEDERKNANAMASAENAKERDKLMLYLEGKNVKPEQKVRRVTEQPRSLKNIDLAEFRMRRLDVLDEENQRNYAWYQKQKK